MKDKINYVQVPGYTEPEQLLNLLKAAGFTTVARTTERLLKTKDGTYSLPLFRINEKNEAIGLSMRESLEVAEELPKVHSIASLLADRYMSDIDLVDKHPETGEHHRGLGYVSARIKGILQPYKQVGGVLIQSYIQGIMTEKNVAANAFWPVMVEMSETLAQVAQATKGLEPEMVDDGTQFIYLHGSVHKDQLRALLKDCGYKLTPETFRSLTKNDKGSYSNILIKVTDGMAVCLSPEEAEQNIMHPGRKHLHEVLGPKVITNISISRKHPETGIPHESGGAFIKADIHNIPCSVMPIGETLFNQYNRGYHTSMDIASGIYRNLLVAYYRGVTTQVDCGSRYSNGIETFYYCDNCGEGEIYKDMTAFDEKEGICFIDKDDYLNYKREWLTRSKAPDINEYGVTYQDLITYARELGIRYPEEVARHCLLNCTWQSVYTELQQFHDNCEEEELLELDEEIEDRYNLFVEQKGQQPNYAEVYVKFMNDGNGMRAMIALNDKAGEYADDEIFFTCSSFDEFKKLVKEDNGEDFTVRQIFGYYAGTLNLGQQQKTSIDESAQINTGTPNKVLNDAERKDRDIQHITDVQVYRCSKSEYATEYRMRCKIDGVQQMGKLLTTAQVEDLANGVDRLKMASEIFAKEIKQIGIGRLQGFKTGLGR